MEKVTNQAAPEATKGCIIPPTRPIDRKALREARRYLYEQNKLYTHVLQEIPREKWPTNVDTNSTRTRVWRSRHYLVQEFTTRLAIRLSICRTELDDDGGWKSAITWDQLQEIKRAVGYGNETMVEIFPADRDLVNVANFRHLWLPSVPLTFGWKEKNESPA